MNEVGCNRCKKSYTYFNKCNVPRNTITFFNCSTIPKINSNNTIQKRTKCWKLTIKTPEEDRSTFLLLTLSNFYLIFLDYYGFFFATYPMLSNISSPHLTLPPIHTTGNKKNVELQFDRSPSGWSHPNATVSSWTLSLDNVADILQAVDRWWSSQTRSSTL